MFDRTEYERLRKEARRWVLDRVEREGRIDALENRLLAAVWQEGYLRGTLDNEQDLEPAGNPYR